MILDSLPKDAYVFVETDVVFSLLTQQIIYKYRTDIRVVPTSFVVQPDNQRGNQQKLIFADRTGSYQTDQLVEEIVRLLDLRHRVFVYHPATELLEQLGVEGNPFYALPKGYVLEIASQPLKTSAASYSLSEQLSNRHLQPFDWWAHGFKGHVATVHAQQGYYYARMGEIQQAESQKQLAKELSTLPSSLAYIDQSLSTGLNRFESEQSYMGYSPLTYEQYLQLGDGAYDRSEVMSAQYYWERAVAVRPEGLEARERLVRMLHELGQAESVAHQLRMIDYYREKDKNNNRLINRQ
jgi:hypothetical protein